MEKRGKQASKRKGERMKPIKRTKHCELGTDSKKSKGTADLFDMDMTEAEIEEKPALEEYEELTAR